jgi:hypothetical protein
MDEVSDGGQRFGRPDGDQPGEIKRRRAMCLALMAAVTEPIRPTFSAWRGSGRTAPRAFEPRGQVTIDLAALGVCRGKAALSSGVSPVRQP